MNANFCDKLYQFLSDYINQHGVSPLYSQITEAMGISPRSQSLITRSLRILEKKKKVVLKKEGRRLLISLTNNQIALLGRVSAGVPIEAITEYDFLDLNNVFDGSDRFALIVKGTSMIDEGIMNGDIIICRKSASAGEGEIVVALIDQHNTTLKRISYRVKGMVTLIPANSELKPRAYTPDRIQVQGIYMGLVRTNHKVMM
jgi:repressor LexA